jgi:hypothetical protein
LDVSTLEGLSEEELWKRYNAHPCKNTEWDTTLSLDIARRLRENTALSGPSQLHAKSAPCVPAALDPFHMHSLVMFSLSLINPLRDGIAQISLSVNYLGIVLAGTLCAGLGIGLALRAGC